MEEENNTNQAVEYYCSNCGAPINPDARTAVLNLGR
jgi:DNA-directed RNA polymerase subunit RPC12/RpoP